MSSWLGGSGNRIQWMPSALTISNRVGEKGVASEIIVVASVVVVLTDSVSDSLPTVIDELTDLVSAINSLRSAVLDLTDLYANGVSKEVPVGGISCVVVESVGIVVMQRPILQYCVGESG